MPLPPLGRREILAKGLDREYLKFQVQLRRQSPIYAVQDAEETAVCSDPRGEGDYPALQGSFPAHSPCKPATILPSAALLSRDTRAPRGARLTA